MDPKDPVAWDDLEAVRPEPDCRRFFEANREAVEGAATLGEAVRFLYERYHEEYDADRRVPDQGAAFVFAYLVERAGIASPDDRAHDDDPGGGAVPSLVDRKPDDGSLERIFWEDEEVPWWSSVRWGVHYSLVIFWLWEADIPLMRRNVPDATLERIENHDQ